MLVFDIVEADPIDATIGKTEDKAEAPKKSNKPATPEKREEIKKELINEDGKATDVQVKSIKNGLKKLREKGDSYEPYIKEIVSKIKSGLNKSEAENILIEIGDKITE
jgi:transcriptional regulator NrdR family protein